MKRLLIVFFLAQGLTVFSQGELRLFTGDFDQAIDSAQKSDKDIFLITRSFKCHVFEKFKAILTSDKASIEFLNTNFIVYEYDMDKATDDERMRMKMYYHSWRGFPQLYFIDKNEKLISDLNYALKIEQSQHLEIWKDYKNIESDWKEIKRLKNNKTIDYNNLNTFLTYRQIKYSPYDLIQIRRVLDVYFKNLDSTQYSDKQNWDLIQKYVTVYSNPEIFDLVAKNKPDFQKSVGDSIVSSYLSFNYQRYIAWRKPEKVNKMAERYPYNSVPEAIKAIEAYKRNKEMKPLIQYSDN
jgi:thioredoxin-related protein